MFGFNSPDQTSRNNNNGLIQGNIVEGTFPGGIRLSGCNHCTVDSNTLNGGTGVGIHPESGKIGSGINFAALANQNCKVSNNALTNVPEAIFFYTYNIAATDDPKWWKMDCDVTNNVVSGAKFSPLIISAANPAGIDGTGTIGYVNVNGFHATGTTAVSIRNLVSSKLGDITNNGGDISITGPVSLSPLAANQPKSGLLIGALHSNGGRIILQNLRGFSAALLESVDGPDEGVVFDTSTEGNVSLASVQNCSRRSQHACLYFHRSQYISMNEYDLRQDSLPHYSVAIDGGDAADISHDLSIGIMKYTGQNPADAGNGIVMQGGAYSPRNIFIPAITWNGAYSAPFILLNGK